MDEVVARLESAEAGSRELDRAIAEDALGLVTEYIAADQPQMTLVVMPLVKAGMPELPHYTTSIDAALTLVPEGWDWCVAIRYERPRADLGKRDGSSDWPVGGEGSTPALALCAACLRARQHQAMKEAGDA